ncbi:MAG: cysteine rich repeat-containing protein [Casimicrobium sp.]
MKTRIITAATIFLSLTIATSAFAQQRDAMKACADDVKTLCAGVERGDGRIAKCLKENESKVSAACKEKLKAAADSRGKGGRGARNSGSATSASSN